MSATPEEMKLKDYDILFVPGDTATDMYYLQSGKVLVFVQKGSQITPLAYLEKGEVIGELSFFDHQPRSAGVICLSECSFIKIPSAIVDAKFPEWLRILALNLTAKIRKSDELIRQKGMRKKNLQTIKPLSIEEQTKIYRKLTEMGKN